MNGTISSLLSLPCYPTSDLMWTVFYSTPLKGHSTIGPGKWGSLISPGSIPLIVNIAFSSFDCLFLFLCFLVSEMYDTIHILAKSLQEVGSRSFIRFLHFFQVRCKKNFSYNEEF